jgi:Tfp pilus assembly protein PilF
MTPNVWMSLSAVALLTLAAGCASGPRPAPQAANQGAGAAAQAPPKQVQAAPSKAPQEYQEEALSAWKEDDVDAAEKELLEAVEKHASWGWGWAALGVIAERQGDSMLAESRYRKALATEPNQPLAWKNLARMYCRQERASTLEAELSSGRNLAQAEEGPSLAYGILALCKGDLKTAEAQTKAVLRRDQKNVQAMHLLSRVYLADNKVELAKMVLDNALAVQPENAALWNALGLVQLSLQSKPLAKEAFEKAAALSPDFAEAQNNLGALLNDAEQYEQAVEHLKRAVENAPQLARAHLNLGNAYRGLGKAAEAQAAYEAALKQSPNLAEAYFNLALLHLDSEIPSADTAERLGKALTYFREFQERGGKDERLAQYVKDARGRIEKDNRRKERERRAKGEARPPETPSAKPAASSGKLLDRQP